MKRERDDRQVDHHSLAMANCLMLLSKAAAHHCSINSSSNTRVFECKTCNRQFSSFQALGGHRASHKKPRMMLADGGEGDNSNDVHGSSSSSPAKPKTHGCSICGLEFAIGQALGGHMRRHRAPISNSMTLTSTSNSGSGTTSLDSSSPTTTITNKNKVAIKTGDDGKRAVLFLDLNLTPLENDLELLRIRNPAFATPLVDCFY